MKMVKSLLLGSAAGVVAVAGAQAADLPVKAKPVEYVKICSLYGDGFYYIPGTETCVRIGASAQADYYYGSLSNGHILFDGAGGAHDRTVSEHAMKGHGQIGLDGRTQTAYGTLRSVVVFKFENVDGGTLTPNLPRSFIQWAGFTFGHTKSYSDPYGSFGGGIGDHKDREYLSVQSPHAGKGHQVQIYSIQDQLNGHQHDHHIPAREHTNDSQHEQCCGHDQVVQGCDWNHMALGFQLSALSKNCLFPKSILYSRRR